MIEMPTYMLIRHKARDFFEWKRVYDTQLMKRIEAGLVEKYVFRGADDTEQKSPHHFVFLTTGFGCAETHR